MCFLHKHVFTNTVFKKYKTTHAFMDDYIT